MASSTTVKLICLAIISVAVVNGPVAEAITCGDVARNVGTCVTYLKNGGNVVPQDCCNGIKTLISAAQTTVDRQTVCNCLKKASGGVDVGLAASLPQKCGVTIPYKLSPSTDCTTVK